MDGEFRDRSVAAGMEPDERSDDDGDRKNVFTIGDLAREFDVTLRALRFYEDKGLLQPERQGMQRLYSRRDRKRLSLILMGKRLGFALGEIREMLDLYDTDGGEVTQLRVSLEKFEAQIDLLEEQRTEIESALSELREKQSVMQRLLKERT